MVEETEYDDTVQCDHSYDRRWAFLLRFGMQQRNTRREKQNFLDCQKFLHVSSSWKASISRCHQTFVTQYESQQEEECEENFRKNCFIEYEKIAFNETVTSNQKLVDTLHWPVAGENLPGAARKRLWPPWGGDLQVLNTSNPPWRITSTS